ncbi:hypothetical protein C8Q73DRAFT_139210 [Cubamyces lactineus]|nr:hypothetical protein C8Q73DRAFT_139210 [Cubamyces lactineus]
MTTFSASGVLVLVQSREVFIRCAQTRVILAIALSDPHRRTGGDRPNEGCAPVRRGPCRPLDPLSAFQCTLTSTCRLSLSHRPGPPTLHLHFILTSCLARALVTSIRVTRRKRRKKLYSYATGLAHTHILSHHPLIHHPSYPRAHSLFHPPTHFLICQCSCLGIWISTSVGLCARGCRSCPHPSSSSFIPSSTSDRHTHPAHAPTTL